MNRKSASEGGVGGKKMNWTWPSRSGTVLTDHATCAENRLKAVKRAAKTLKKSVEDSIRTSSRNKNEELEIRKRRSNEFVLGENIAIAVHILAEDKSSSNNETCSPLNTVMERYANFEKTIGLMFADSELKITTFLASDTPLSKLLHEEIPAVTAAKKDLEQLTRRHLNLQAVLEKETKKLEKMSNEDEVDNDALKLQEEKKQKLAHEVDTLAKDVTLEQDKLTSTLLTLVSRENRYASSVLELMRIKQQFYANAYNTISAELPNIERILQETPLRPVFGEPLEDHLSATGRTIAFPISLTVTFLRESGLNDEGLFRISPKQIKLDKFKAYLDAQLPFGQLLVDSDAHLHSALLKSYLRELPVPLLGRKQNHVYDRWLGSVKLATPAEMVREIRYILKEELPPPVVTNIQYVVKFLAELSKKSQTNKMTPHNMGIVLGPTLLWSSRGGALSEQSNIESIIKLVATLIEHYKDIFPVDIQWGQFDDDLSHLMVDGDGSPTSSKLNSPTEEDSRSGRSLTPVPNNNHPEQPSPGHRKRNALKTKILAKINSPSLTSSSAAAIKPVDDWDSLH